MAKPSGRQPRKGDSLRRRIAVRTPKRTFLVFCEGERTEPDYLKALKQEPAIRDTAAVDIKIHPDTGDYAPLSLVAAAVNARNRAPGEEGEIDEVWCLFDVEWPRNHPNLDRAIALARKSDVHLAISNPCFELWLALHFGEHTAWLDTRAATKLCRDHMTSGKGLNGAVYMPRRADAARRARYLSDKHEQDGTDFPNDNPSSGMFRFLDAIERGA